MRRLAPTICRSRDRPDGRGRPAHCTLTSVADLVRDALQRCDPARTGTRSSRASPSAMTARRRTRAGRLPLPARRPASTRRRSRRRRRPSADARPTSRAKRWARRAGRAAGRAATGRAAWTSSSRSSCARCPRSRTAPVPAPPLASQPVMARASGRFVIRCVYERPLCGPLDPPVLSAPTPAVPARGLLRPRRARAAHPHRAADRHDARGPAQVRQEHGLHDLRRAVRPDAAHEAAHASATWCSRCCRGRSTKTSRRRCRTIEAVQDAARHSG